MKKLNVVGLIVMGLLGIVGMSTSAKADVQKLDVQQMQQVKGGSTSYARCDNQQNDGGHCYPVAVGAEKVYGIPYSTCLPATYPAQSCPTDHPVVSGVVYSGPGCNPDGTLEGGLDTYERTVCEIGCIGTICPCPDGKSCHELGGRLPF